MKNICMTFKGPSQLLEIVLDLGAYLYCKISGKAPFLSYYSKKKKKKNTEGRGYIWPFSCYLIQKQAFVLSKFQWVFIVPF